MSRLLLECYKKGEKGCKENDKSQNLGEREVNSTKNDKKLKFLSRTN
jgi:hypothetical protein